MLLREHLEEYTKEELLDQARSFELKKCSGLRKAALIDRILECFCTEEMLRNRLTCLTKEQITLFRKACDIPRDISINEVMDGMQLCRYWLGYFEESTDRFNVFEEVAEIFSKIDDETFRTEQYKKGWMMKCVHYFANYYGIAPVEIIYELYRLKVRDTIDEMIDMLWGMPIDIVESCIFPMEKLGLQDWPKDDPIYSSKGLLIHIPILEDEEFTHLLDRQMDKEFYIPSVQQIEEICRIGYEASSLAYKKLETFFMRKMDMSYEQAVTWCLQVWANSYEGESPMDVISKMSETDIVFKSEKQMNEFVGLLMDAHNNTRMKENRGHKPNELVRKDFAGGMPTLPDCLIFLINYRKVYQEVSPYMEETVFNKEQLWQSRLDACQKSGMSAKQWCAQNHIAYSAYFYWAKKSKVASNPEKGNLSGEMVFAQLPSEQDILTRPQKISAPVSMFLGNIRIDVTSSCPQTLLHALIEVLKQYA